MRLNSIKIAKIDQIQRFEIEGLADTIVLAGPNGVGKTRIISTLLQFFQNPQPRPGLVLEIAATCTDEQIEFSKSVLSTHDPSDCAKLRQVLHRNQRRAKYQSTMLNYDSNRGVMQPQPFNFSWDIRDPFGEDVSWSIGYDSLSNRYNDVRHTIFRRVEAQRRQIAQHAIDLKNAGKSEMGLDFADPLENFKAIFSQLLAPKRFLDPDTVNQQILYEYEGKRLQFETLSSGEREVVNVAFDFLIRGPSDSIIFFDEPELHLHPELSYKLLQTLTGIGKNNQFIFCTHSPEIITASIENSVVFLRPAINETTNQAIPVLRDDPTHAALNLLGQSIGIVSLGKKIILIEGDESSTDKQVYGAILLNSFPEFVLVLVGGKEKINSFSKLKDGVLDKTIWGVEFFMLCDRDFVNRLGAESVRNNISARMKLLPRYHVENYFLDEAVIARFCELIEPTGSQWRDPLYVNGVLREVARDSIPHAVALDVAARLRERVGNVDLMPKGIQNSTTPDELIDAVQVRASAEARRVATNLELPEVSTLVRSTFERLDASVKNDTRDWRYDLPGKAIVQRLAARMNLPIGRFKHLFLQSAKAHSNATFNEITAIFTEFREGR